jgi:hypothetical protein
MSYPISINREVTIVCRKLTLEQIVGMFSKELKTNGNSIIKVIGQKINILESKEFSSKTTLKEFNRGSITFIKDDDVIRIKGKILLIEHLVVFISVVLLTIGLFQAGKDGIYIGILLFPVIFVFLYLFPMMAFYSFFGKLIKRIEEEEIKK